MQIDFIATHVGTKGAMSPVTARAQPAKEASTRPQVGSVVVVAARALAERMKPLRLVLTRLLDHVLTCFDGFFWPWNKTSVIQQSHNRYLGSCWYFAARRSQIRTYGPGLISNPSWQNSSLQTATLQHGKSSGLRCPEAEHQPQVHPP